MAKENLLPPTLIQTKIILKKTYLRISLKGRQIMPNLKMLKPKHGWLSALRITSSGPQSLEIRPDNKNLEEENDDLESHLDEATRPHA